MSTEYNVIAELDTTLTADRADQWLTSLAPYSPAAVSTPRGRAQLVLTLPADTLDQAVSSGLAVLTRAAGKLFTLTVMPTEEFDRRAGDVEVPELVGATEAAQLAGVTRQRIQQLAAAGDLPTVRIGERALAFPKSAIEHYAALARTKRPGPGASRNSPAEPSSVD